MNRTEAETLLAKIAAIWPLRLNAYGEQAWLEELDQLDAGQAGTALVRLRRERSTAPSIADFVGACGAVDTRRPEGPATVCGRCDGSGWEFVAENAVVRCPCPPSEQRPVPPRMPLVRS